MPQYLEFPVKDDKSYEGVLFRRNAASPERWNAETWQRWHEESVVLRAPVAVFVVGFLAIVRELMGVEEGLVAFYTKQGLIRRILRDHCDFCVELVRRARERTRVDFCMLWEEMSYKNGMLISPALFEEFISPEARRFIEAIGDAGVPTTIADSDGDIRELIPLYVRCGVSDFLPFEAQAGMDIRDVREKHPDLIIIGGIDKLAVAREEETLQAEIREKVGPMVEQGKYIPSLDHQAHPEMSPENYQRYAREVNALLSRASGRGTRGIV